MNINYNSINSLLIAGVLFLVAPFQMFADEMETNTISITTYITTENFEAEVIQADLPVLVDFTATWCVPCREVDPIIDELFVELDGKVKIFKLDIDESPEIYREYRVNGIPHILFFRDGVEEDRIGSVQEKSVYINYVEGMLAGKSAYDITLEMLESDEFRRFFILGRDFEVVESAVQSVPTLLTEAFENGQTPLSLILNRPSVKQNDLITLALSFEPEISTHDLVGLGRCDEFLEAIKEDPDAVNRLDPDGNSVLITAMLRANRLGEKDCTPAVLTTDIDLSKQKSPIFSLGRVIALHQDINLTEQLIELGWDVDLQDDQGQSTLQWAAFYGYADSVLYLLEQGADATLKYPDGLSVIDHVKRTYARSKQSLDAMQSNEEMDFSEQIKNVQASIKKHEQVLALLEEKLENDLTSTESETTL